MLNNKLLQEKKPPTFTFGPIIDLKTFNFETYIPAFYAESMKHDSLRNNKTKQYIQKRTLTTYDDGLKTFGIYYRVAGRTEGDIVGKYNNVNFCHIESMVNENNELMILNALIELSTSDMINKLITDLNTEFNTKPIINKNDPDFINYRILNWRNENKVVKLVTSRKLNLSNIIIDNESSEILSNIENQVLYSSIIYICLPKYEKKLLGVSEVNPNYNWSRFK